MKTYLRVPFDQKDRAKAKGARWDPARKQWYCPDGIDLMLFKQWLPNNLSNWLGYLPKKRRDPR